MCKEDRCVGLGQRLHKGGGNCLKNLKRGWDRKEGKENKDFKKKGGGAQIGSSVGALGLEPPYEL